ncbi:MAG: methyltransferase domain-containing protein [Chloroflexi bacterium]|nr:methyltransferase domain-containing protein [Chloroflexota bacterium]
MRLRPILRGLKSYLPWVTFPAGTGGTDSARYCYTVWLRHQVTLYERGLNPYPETIAELGPGDSLGIGLAGLLSGARQYFALDVVEHASATRNLAIFESLLELFQARARLPDEREFPQVFPRLASYAFPSHILDEQRLSDSLSYERIAQIRQDLHKLADKEPVKTVHYLCPWDDAEVIQEASTDLIFSQAVLEHVNDIRFTYRACHRWLKPGGVMSHQIDFKSHGVTDEWNGHWSYSDFLWTIAKGRKPYFLNREPLSAHIRAMQEAGFRIAAVLPVRDESGLKRRQLARRFRNLPDEDIVTSSAHILAVKRD